MTDGKESYFPEGTEHQEVLKTMGLLDFVWDSAKNEHIVNSRGHLAKVEEYDPATMLAERRLDEANLTEEERKFFRRLTKRAFEHRRKQLGSVFKDLIQSTARAEELSNADWIELVKGMMKNEDA